MILSLTATFVVSWSGPLQRCNCTYNIIGYSSPSSSFVMSMGSFILLIAYLTVDFQVYVEKDKKTSSQPVRGYNPRNLISF